jgi:hypothetical protein
VLYSVSEVRSLVQTPLRSDTEKINCGWTVRRMLSAQQGHQAAVVEGYIDLLLSSTECSVTKPAHTKPFHFIDDADLVIGFLSRSKCLLAFARSPQISARNWRTAPEFRRPAGEGSGLS